MEALEDSIEHSVEGPVEVRPQKLSRLRKAKERATIPNDENVAHNSDRIQGCCEATRPEGQTFLHKEPKSPTMPEEVGVAMETPDRAPSVSEVGTNVMHVNCVAWTPAKPHKHCCSSG